MGKTFVCMSVLYDNLNLTGTGKSRFFLSTDHEKDWQLYPVKAMTTDTYTHIKHHEQKQS